MIHYNLSPAQLEEHAECLLRQFDDERLKRTKPIDPYAVIEKCLDVPYDWKYITPDQSILGATAFRAGTTWVWPKPYYEDGMMPEKIYLDKGTILIDSTLTESEDRGPENFTVMHEVFHQVLHKTCFTHCNPDYFHTTSSDTLRACSDKRRHMTSLEICEYQANFCAAAFLMPRKLVRSMATGANLLGKLNANVRQDRQTIYQLAHEFNVSFSAMKYRLIRLGLAEE